VETICNLFDNGIARGCDDEMPDIALFHITKGENVGETERLVSFLVIKQGKAGLQKKRIHKTLDPMIFLGDILLVIF